MPAETAVLPPAEAAAPIRTRPVPACALCGRAGRPLYRGLRDRVFGVPGGWDLSLCPDPRCGLVWLDPRPVPEDLGRAYQSYYTHEAVGTPRGLLRRGLAAAGCGHLRARLGYTRGVGPRWLSLLAPLVDLHPGGRDEVEADVAFQGAPGPGRNRLLDVGCGSGGLMERTRGLGWEVEGTEVDPRASAAARGRGLTVHDGDLAACAFPGGSFDVVHLGHVIEHVDDPEGLLRECRRVLKPGGRLVILTPNAAGWGHRHFGGDWRGLEPPRHLHVFNPANLAAAVARAGFARSEVRTLSRAARTVLVVSALARAGRLAGGEGLGRYGLRWKAAGVLYQLRERALNWSRGDAGEELLCTAHK